MPQREQVTVHRRGSVGKLRLAAAVCALLSTPVYAGESISRAFTVVNHTATPVVYREAISRAFTVVNHTDTPLVYREAISRAFTVVNSPRVTVEFREAISRAFTVVNHTTTPLIFREAISRAFTVRRCAVVDCDDLDVCTCDRCVSGECGHLLTRYGDVKCSDAPAIANLDDILCVIGGFGEFYACPNGDLAPPCSGNDVINLDDILAVLAAFAGEDPCGCGD